MDEQEIHIDTKPELMDINYNYTLVNHRDVVENDIFIRIYIKHLEFLQSAGTRLLPSQCLGPPELTVHSYIHLLQSRAMALQMPTSL